ncbi:hypothetical protein [Hymenobacter jeollabukensis]|uniref:Uncharacterized protein n=1 Tax=Hymenobacter jeollabukensis TaxID=2025313 RepID=A0A5R8WLW9_9BACT|nr:hypothetical protein [Hymenobacter jeollabukensis]TLM90132.1 hypothetical protein FDY95_19160 [Hymenobacter jeollabukensis]
MKTPDQYLNVPTFHLTYPTGEDAEMVPVVTYDDALRAVESALADAEKYRYLLMRALRRSQEPEAADLVLSPEAAVRPLYPETDLAA